MPVKPGDTDRESSAKATKRRLEALANGGLG